jgi:hypothetical protein
MAIIDLIKVGEQVIEQIKAHSVERISEFKDLSIKELDDLRDEYQRQVEEETTPDGMPLSLLEIQIADIKFDEITEVMKEKLKNDGIRPENFFSNQTSIRNAQEQDNTVEQNSAVETAQLGV